MKSVKMEGSEDVKLVELGQCYLPSGELLNAVIAFLFVWSLRGLLRRNLAMYISKNFHTFLTAPNRAIGG
jgi:hypothetical protein